jgi:hypothetical protein
MRRRLSTLVSALLVLAFLGTSAIWIGSYYVNAWVGRVHYAPGIDSEDHHVWLVANCGMLSLITGGDPVENFPAVHWEWRQMPPDPGSTYIHGDGPQFLRAMGIGWERERRIITGEWTSSVQIRLAWPAALSGLTVLGWLRPWRRKRRADHLAQWGFDIPAAPPRTGRRVRNGFGGFASRRDAHGRCSRRSSRG